MFTRRLKREEGTSLVIVLIMISVFGLILTALLTEAGASVRYTDSVSSHEKKLYAADAAVALGIQQLQQNIEICPSTGVSETIQTTTVNGLPAQVTCETTSGSTASHLGYAVVTMSPAANSLTIQSGNAKRIYGPVHVTGNVDGWNKGLDVDSGNFTQTQGNGCTATADPNLTLDAGYGFFCNATVPTLPTIAVPTMPVAPRAATTFATCKIFYPGRYTSAPAIDVTKVNYFASGVYYFNFAGPITVAGSGPNDMVVFGGEKASWETAQYSSLLPACAHDTQAIAAAGGSAPEVNGTGVQFIFGGGASLALDNKSKTELFVRTADATTATAAPSFIAVPPTSAWTTAGYTPNTADTNVLNFSSGSDKGFLAHGLVYAPNHNVVLYATNGVDASVLGGVVAWELDLQSSAAGSGLTVSATDGIPDPRHIIVRGTAPFPASAATGRQVVSTAVIQIANDTARTVTVESWRTRGPADAL